MRFFVLTCWLALVSMPWAAPAAGQTALRIDPFAGQTAAYLNPAATAAVPYGWDLTLGAAAAGVHNNWLLVEEAAALPLLRQTLGPGGLSVDDNDFRFVAGGQTYRYGFPGVDGPVRATVGASVAGPGLSVQLGERTRVGAFTRLRGRASVASLDANFQYETYDAIPLGSTFTVAAGRTDAALWGEVGLQLARAIDLGDGNELRLGLTPRYLIGYEGAAASNAAGARVTKAGRDSLQFRVADVSVAYTGALRDGTGVGRRRGQGWAVDLGVQYAWGDDLDRGYRYVLGASVLDLGGITFDRATRVHRFRTAADAGVTVTERDLDTDADAPGEPIDQITRRLSALVYDDPAASVTDEPFRVNLPLALSVQFAYRPTEHTQLSVVYRGDLPVRDQLRAGQQLTAAAHYSRWWFGAAVTAGLTDWRTPEVGGMLRAGPFFVGTDTLFGTLLARNELSGADVYAGVRLHSLRPGRRRAARGWRGQEVRCYQF